MASESSDALTAPSSVTDPNIDTLIVVACHAVYVGGPTNGEDESEWLIEPFQKGETPTFIEHIYRGVQELRNYRERGVLCFSGGATRALRTSGGSRLTEGDSYLDIALRRDLFWEQGDIYRPTTQNLRGQTFVERWATDSFQNILFPLIHWSVWSQIVLRQRGEPQQMVTPLALPKNLIIISHEFKRARFMNLHIPAIKLLWQDSPAFNRMSVTFIGINPPFDEIKIREIEEGDRRSGYGAWKIDILGTGEFLTRKRKERGWCKDDFLSSMQVFFDADEMEDIGQMVEGISRVDRLLD